MRKSFIVFSGLLILGLLLTACQTAAEPAEETVAEEAEVAMEEPAEEADAKQVALGMYFRRDEWWQDLEKTAKDTAESNGMEFLVADADGDSATQLQQVETFVSQGVDAIVYAPVDVSATN